MSAVTAQAAPKAPASARRQKSQFVERMKLRAPLLPALIFVALLTQIPFIYTLYLSTLKWNSLRPDRAHKFVWFDNYKAAFQDEELRSAIWVTVKLTLLVVLVSLVIGLVLALLLDRKFKGQGVVRTLLIGPFLIVPMAGALLWKHAFYNPDFGFIDGAINAVHKLWGDDTPTRWSLLSSHPLLGVAIPLIWQWTPFMMLILLAGLQSQPGDVLEAARVDGASDGQIFRTMTLPHLRQYLELSATLGTIYIIQAFDSIYTITSGGQGTANVPYQIYHTFTVGGQYGQTAAAGVIVVFMTIIVATFALRVASGLFKEGAR